jgi:hypothetical protein
MNNTILWNDTVLWKKIQDNPEKMLAILVDLWGYKALWKVWPRKQCASLDHWKLYKLTVEWWTGLESARPLPYTNNYKFVGDLYDAEWHL